MEGRLNGRNRTLDLHIHAVERAAYDRQAVGLGKVHHSVIVRLAGAKPRGELLWSEELPVRRTARIIEFAQERIQACLIPHRQHDIQLQDLVCGKPPDWLRLSVENCLTHMVRHQRLRTAVHTSSH
jgi:hypothetical protein